MNPVRDDTNKALQYRHISSVLTYLRNGLDSCLRRNDKKFSHSLVGRNDREKWGNDKSFHISSTQAPLLEQQNVLDAIAKFSDGVR
ncbi:MAG: hypothetical protein RBS43_05090 [Candidatus Cloacimonas sp.]|nr:hypothetical protein [Candidatus Cloacimonas sp.]